MGPALRTVLIPGGPTRAEAAPPAARFDGFYLPVRMIEASCFPGGRRRTWESFLGDELARLVSGGEFSRTELVRSFVRSPGAAVLPTVFELRGRGPLSTAR